jgi:hypothetical protein
MYRVYGLRLASNLSFPHLLEESSEADTTPDLTLHVQPPNSETPVSAGLPGVLLWRHNSAGQLRLSVYQIDDRILFHYHRRAQFLFDPELNEVICTPHPGQRDEEIIRFLFLGLVVSFALHLRGLHNLHASAVKIGNGAVAFSAPPGGGKSTLTTYFLNAGHALLSDDVLPLQLRGEEIYALPGPPQLRLWPDAAARLWCDPLTLPRHALQTEKRQIWLPHSKRFYCREPLPLRTIYFLERSQTRKSSIEPVSQRETLLALVCSTFGNFLLDGALLARQMAFFAQAVPKVVCRRLRVPLDFDGLSSTYDMILGDRPTL